MNGLHVEGTRLLMNALRGNDSLKELDLSANRMEKEAAKTVARTLPHLLQLTALKVRKGYVGVTGGVRVSAYVFPACNQCCIVGSSLVRDLNFHALI